MNSSKKINALSYTGEKGGTIDNISTKLLNSVKIGEFSGNLATGLNNVFVGYKSGMNSKENLECVFIGSRSGKYTTKGNFNTLIGSDTGYNMNNGSFNTITGYKAGSNIYDGSYNTYFGYNTGEKNKDGNYNCIFGISSGIEMKNSCYNILLGTNTGNNLDYGNSNILIGNYTETLDKIINDSIIIGNSSKANNNSIVIGKNNYCKSINNISIGTNIENDSTSRIMDPLNQYDELIIQNAKERLNIEKIIAYPINNNLIYKPLNKYKKNSYENNINEKILEYTYPRIKLEYIPTSITTLKNIVKPIISTGYYENIINLNIKSNDDYLVYIVSLPKYGYVEKLIYEKDEPIIIKEYPELSLINEDEIIVTTIIYGFISSFSKKLTLKRKTFSYPKNIDTIITSTRTFMIYSKMIYNNSSIYTYEIKENIRFTYYDKNIIFVNKLEHISLSLYNDNDGKISINNKEIIIKKYDTYMENISNEFEIMFKSIENEYKIYHNFELSNEYSIYIEKPLENGYFNLGNLIEYKDLSNLIYITDNIEYKNDICEIRLIKDNKISIEKYTLYVKNYIFRTYSMYNKTLNDLSLPLSLKEDNYSISYNDNIYEIFHPNKGILSYFNVKEVEINFSEEIVLNNRIMNVKIPAFSSFNIIKEVQNIISNLNKILNINLNIIKSPKFGYIENDMYFNTENVNDEFRLILSTTEYDINDENEIVFFIEINNIFNIHYSDQYFYHKDKELIKTINIENYKDIFLTSNNISYFLENTYIYEGNNDFILTIGHSNIDVGIDISLKGYSNIYIYEYDIENHIFDNNYIEYMFNEHINEDFEINLTFNPSKLFDINIGFFKFHIYLDNIHILLNNENIVINDIIFNYIIKYDFDNKISFINNGILINNVFFEYNFNTFKNIKIQYILNENLININKNNIFLKNYIIQLLIKNFEIVSSTDNINNTHNINIGKDILTNGINNICIGKEFNTFGNNSIILGNNIGTNNIISFDSGLHEFIIIGNNSFQNSLAKNIITIGNNILNDLNINTQEEYIKASNFFSRNPIIIGNSILYNSNDIINIGNCFKEKNDKIVIGKNEKDIYIEGSIKNDDIDELKKRIKKIEELLLKNV